MVLVVQRALNNLVSNADMMIAAYEASFAELKIEFIMGSAVQTNLTMVRILEKVENIGKFHAHSVLLLPTSVPQLI
jgi:hypothetical protein